MNDEHDELSEYDEITNESIKREPQIRRTKAIREVINEMAAERLSKATAKQLQVAEEFYEVVRAFTAKQLTVEQANQLTGDGWLRAMVLSITSIDHPQYQDAMKMLDAIIAHDTSRGERYFTKHGWFTKADIDEQGGRVFIETDVTTGELREVIQFPVGINPNTGQKIWPNREQQLDDERRAAYVSPFREDWLDDDPENKLPSPLS